MSPHPRATATHTNFPANYYLFWLISKPMLYSIYLKPIWKALMTYQWKFIVLQTVSRTPPYYVCNKNCGFEGSSKKKKKMPERIWQGKLWKTFKRLWIILVCLLTLVHRPGLPWISRNPILCGPPLNHPWNLGCHFHKSQPNPNHSNAQSIFCTRGTCLSFTALCVRRGCDRCQERTFIFTRSAIVVRICGFRRLELIT